MAPMTPMKRTGSFSGVWWKLGDDAEVERRLAEEEAAVKASIQRRHDSSRVVRRYLTFTSLSLEVAAMLYGWWTARRFRFRAVKMMKLLLPVLLAVPASAAVVFAAFTRFHKMLDAREQYKLERLRAERKAKLGGHLRPGSQQNLQKLISQKYDPDAADSAEPSAAKIQRTHSRLSFHLGDE